MGRDYLCGETKEVLKKVQSKGCSKKGRKSAHPERIVQAIRGFLFGFRRGGSATSKTRTGGNLVRRTAVGESDSVCVRPAIEVVFLCFA
jgi:hypothetical protein